MEERIKNLAPHPGCCFMTSGGVAKFRGSWMCLHYYNSLIQEVGKVMKSDMVNTLQRE